MADRSAIFSQALARAKANVGGQLQEASDQAQEGTNPLTWALDAVNSAGTGIVKAGIETKEAIFGQPKYEDRWPIQRQIEADAAELDRRSGVNAFVGDASQFITGMLGAGKVMPFLKGANAISKGGAIAREVARGALVGAVAFDPQEERLSDLVEAYPQLSNPITAYLAADVNDSDAEGRFKNALEGIGLDLALTGAFSAAMKLYRAVRSGDEAAVAAAHTELQVAQAQLPQGQNVVQDALGSMAPPAAPLTDEAAMAAIEGGTSAPRPVPPSGPSVAQAADMDAQAMAAMEGGSAPRPDIDQNAMDAIEGTGYAPSSDPAANAPPNPAIQSDPIADALAADMAEVPNGPLAGGGNVVFDEMGNKALQPDAPVTTTIRGEDGEVIGSSTRQEGQPLKLTVEGGSFQAGEPPRGANAPTVQVEPPLETRVETLLKSFDEDMEAINRHGSREAAEMAGHRFGGSGSLPWQKLTDAGEQGLRVFTDEVAAVFKAELDKAKGGDVMSDARVERMIAQRATLYGDDPTAVHGMLQQAGQNAKSMVANMEAGYLIANKAMMDVYRLATNIRMDNFSEFGGNADMAAQALRMRLAMAIEALAQSKAMTAAAGRSLRRMRGQFQVTPEKLAALKSMDVEQLVEILHVSKGNPKELAKMADPGFMDRMLRGAGSLMANNLLWGWPTHAVNMVTAAYMGMVRPAEKIVGSFLVKNGGGLRQQGLKEYAYMVSALGDARKFAVDAFLKGDSILSPHQTEWFTAGAQGQSLKGAAAMGFRPLNTMADYFHNGFTAMNVALGMPTRTLGMMDEFIKQMSYRGYVQAKAAVEAQEMGLEGTAIADYVQKALDDSFDGNYQATNRDALYEAQVRTFSQPLVQKGNGNLPTAGYMLQNNVAQHPALRAVFPFVRTPINVFRYTMKNTPMLNIIQKEYRDMLLGKMGDEQQAHAYGQMFLGSLALASFSMLAANGKVTGGGPNEPGLRKALDATGWKPYSFVFENEDGSHTYVPYNRFDPVGLLAGMATDVTEMLVTYPERQDDADNLATAAVLAIVKNLKDKTYLQSINGVVDALNDPDKSSGKWAGQLAESMIPFSSGIRNYFNPDPYMREARTLVDHALDRMPGFSQKLPPQRDPFGYPVPVRTGLVFQDNANDIVDAEQIRMFQETGAGLAVPTAYDMDGVDLRDLMVEGPNGPTTAYDRYLEITIQPTGIEKPMKETIADLIRSDIYQMAPDGASGDKGTRLNMIQAIVTKYRAAAKKQLLAEYPTEVGQPVGARKAEVNEAWRQNSATQSASQETMSQVQALLAGYGIKG